MYAWLLYLFLVLLLLVGLLVTVMTLPGLWLMVAAAGAYAWLTHGAFISWWTLVTLVALALAGEVIETSAAGAGARRAGAGRRGLWGAIIGGILGGIFLSVIPIPILSTLIGVCLGTFAGATIGELSGGREVARSAIIGASAAAGRIKGTAFKLTIGLIMIAITLWTALPIPRRHQPAGRATGSSLASPRSVASGST